MPVEINADLVPMTQKQFSDVAYEVVGHAFSIHNELGGLFDETVYRNALAKRLGNAQIEVKIDVCFDNFHKFYFIDALVSNGAPFELKTAQSITARHKQQLMNYLLLAQLGHGKVICFGPERVKQDFVNAKLTFRDRRCFSVVDEEWSSTAVFGTDEKTAIVEMLRDWGTGLDRTLYEDGVLHFLGGRKRRLTGVNVYQNGICIGSHKMPLCGDATTTHITTFQDDNEDYQKQLIRLARATKMRCVQWINIARDTVTFKTLRC